MKLVKTFSLILGSVLLASCATASKVPDVDITIPTAEIIFDCGEGIIRNTGMHAKSVKVLLGNKWTKVRTFSPNPNDIINGEATFKEWTIDDGHGTQIPVPEDTTFSEAKTYVISASYNYALKADLIIDPNEGTWSDGTDTSKNLTVPLGARWGEYYDSYIPTPPDPTTQIFEGYRISGELINNDYRFEDNSGPVTLVASYVTSTNTIDFETDPWPIFINAINKGFTSLSTTAEGSGGYSQKFIDNGGTFVGLERNIEIYGETYKVRVIGEDVDRLDVEGTNHATLTFQFEEVVEVGVGWSDEDNNIYQRAKIRTYLNNQFIDAFPDDVYPHIKTVYKRTYFGGGPGVGVEDYNEKIFLPSFAEIGITKLSYSGMPEYSVEEEGFLDETTSKYLKPYAYYQDATDVTRVFNYHNDDTATSYWLRSTDIDAARDAWYITAEGTYSDDGAFPANMGLGICPCFAMGGN